MAKALLPADKTPIPPRVTLRCALAPDAAALLDVIHGSEVIATVRLPEHQMVAFQAALSEASQGRAHWLPEADFCLFGL